MRWEFNGPDHVPNLFDEVSVVAFSDTRHETELFPLTTVYTTKPGQHDDILSKEEIVAVRDRRDGSTQQRIYRSVAVPSRETLSIILGATRVKRASRVEMDFQAQRAPTDT